MKYINSNNEVISAFSLGTVQLGMDYGLIDAKKPTSENAFSILNTALSCGVNILDTAKAYGDSEKVIGEWLKTVERENRPKIVTKIGNFDHTSKETVVSDMINQTKSSLETLGVSKIDYLMLHRYDDWAEDSESIETGFNVLKEKGMISHSAISLYSEHDYKRVAQSDFDAVQIPINLFDWNQINNGGIDSLAESGITVFTRSVFLQGLVFMKPDELDPRMDFCSPVLKKFIQLCEDFKLSPGELAISFVLSLPGIASVVLGCQKPNQVVENSKMVNYARRLSVCEMDEIKRAFSDIDERVINPRAWFNHV